MASEYDLAPSIADLRLQIGVRARIDGLFAALEHRLEAERDQFALWLPIGFGAGIATWFGLPNALAWIGAALAMGALSGAAIVFGGGLRLGQAVAWFAGAMMAGLAIIWLKAVWVAEPRLGERPVVTHFSGRIDLVEPQQARGLVRLTVAPDAATGLPPHVRVNVDAGKLPAYLPTGSRIDLRARLAAPAGPPVPGGYDFAQVVWFQGIGATGKALDKPVLHMRVGEGDFWSWLADIRQRLSTHIETSVQGVGEGGVPLPSSRATKAPSPIATTPRCAAPA